MTAAIDKVLGRLSDDGVKRLFAVAKVRAPEIHGLGQRLRKKRAMEAVVATGDLGRARIEAMAGQIVGLADKGDHAERALRAVSEGRPDLLKDLDADIALEDRILMIWQKDPKLLNGARNLAMGLHWRGGKSHYSFQIAKVTELEKDLRSQTHKGDSLFPRTVIQGPREELECRYDAMS